MHFSSGGITFLELAVWLALSFLLLAVVVAWRMFRRTFGDHTNELDLLTRQFAAGLLTLDQFQKERAKSKEKRLRAINAR